MDRKGRTSYSWVTTPGPVRRDKFRSTPFVCRRARFASAPSRLNISLTVSFCRGGCRSGTLRKAFMERQRKGFIKLPRYAPLFIVRRSLFLYAEALCGSALKRSRAASQSAAIYLLRTLRRDSDKATAYRPNCFPRNSHVPLAPGTRGIQTLASLGSFIRVMLPMIMKRIGCMPPPNESRVGGD